MRTPKALQWLEGHYQGRRGTIRVRDDAAGPAAPFALFQDGLRVIGVDLGNEQRHVRLHAVRFRVAEDGLARAREVCLDLLSRFCRQGGEDDAHFVRQSAGAARAHRHGGYRGGHAASGQPPFRDFSIGSSCPALGYSKRGQFKPGMSLQQLDEALPDHTCRAENGDGNA